MKIDTCMCSDSPHTCWPANRMLILSYKSGEFPLTLFTPDVSRRHRQLHAVVGAVAKVKLYQSSHC